jgi:hypothetical protein
MINAIPRSLPALLALSLLLAHTSSSAQSQTFTFEQGVSGYTGFDDTTIFSESENAGGGTTGIFSGTIFNLDFDGNKQHRRALIRADLSSIPTNWIIEDVSLMLTVQSSGGNFGNIDYTLHRLSDPWGEGTVVGPSAGGFGDTAQTGDATWLSRQHNIALWSVPGADFIASPTATAPAGTAGALVTWTSAAMISDVQQWVSAPASNQGWIIVSTIEGTLQRVKNFYSSESSASGPILLIIARPPAVSVPTTRPGFLLILILVLGLTAKKPLSHPSSRRST